jgi:hypothetical protein
VASTNQVVTTRIGRHFLGVLLLQGRSMGNVKTDEAYRFYQTLIRDLMAELGSPALFFGYFAWNLRDA